MQRLKGKVALVAGATRGAGRGIACMLGEAGATVYCSSRSTREHPFGVTEANWRQAAEKNTKAKSYGFINSETPCFVGRAIAALAADPEVLKKSGGLYSSWGLAREYGFMDLDGSQPDLSQHFDFEELFRSKTGFRWMVSRPSAAQREGKR